VILLIKPLTEDRRLPRRGMNDLATRLGSKRLKHPPATHHHGKRIESVHPVQPHGKITGHIKPERHLFSRSAFLWTKSQEKNETPEIFFQGE
jgi:hypothetical protein